MMNTLMDKMATISFIEETPESITALVKDHIKETTKKLKKAKSNQNAELIIVCASLDMIGHVLAMDNKTITKIIDAIKIDKTAEQVKTQCLRLLKEAVEIIEKDVK